MSIRSSWFTVVQIFYFFVDLMSSCLSINESEALNSLLLLNCLFLTLFL